MDTNRPLLSKYKFLFVNISIPVVFSLYSPTLNSSSIDWDTESLRNEYFENSSGSVRIPSLLIFTESALIEVRCSYAVNLSIISYP